MSSFPARRRGSLGQWPHLRAHFAVKDYRPVAPSMCAPSLSTEEVQGRVWDEAHRVMGGHDNTFARWVGEQTRIAVEDHQPRGIVDEVDQMEGRERVRRARMVGVHGNSCDRWVFGIAFWVSRRG